jgi:hypothetical protein
MWVKSRIQRAESAKYISTGSRPILTWQQMHLPNTQGDNINKGEKRPLVILNDIEDYLLNEVKNLHKAISSQHKDRTEIKRLHTYHAIKILCSLSE